MEFEWDHDKAAGNEGKHGVSFVEASTVFNDDYAVTAYDPDHSDNEDRYIMMGMSSNARLIIVSFTDRDENIRIISARPASKAERKDYEDGNWP
jgi:uncharacterized protein